MQTTTTTKTRKPVTTATKIKDAVALHATSAEHEARLWPADRLPKWVVPCIEGAARGCYQDWLLRGYESWSGASLKGKAQDYSARYERSRCALLRRIQRRLARSGWGADVPLVLNPETHRWTRELIIESPGGRLFAW